MKKKLFWGAVALEIVVASWFGWQFAKAQQRPWSVPLRPRKGR